MFPMCSLSHSPMFPNNSAIRIISCMWRPCHLRCDCTWHSLLHHLHWQALELRHLHCAPPSSSRFSHSIVASAHNCYYHGHFLGLHSQDLKNNLIIQKNVCEKKWSERTERLCSKRRYDGCEVPGEMIPRVGWCIIHLGEKLNKIPSQEMMIVCVNSLAKAKRPLEKVVAMAQLCEYRHWWYLALWWCWWYIAFYKWLVQC
jgi:hypothetical protein